jgi:hypothetical protein
VGVLMALQKTTVSVNMGIGVDQKADDKAAPQNNYKTLTDMVFNKFLRIDKRPGTLRLPTDVSTTFPNPLDIGPSEIKSSLTTHNQQLLLQNKGALYSYSEDQESWIFKSHYYPLEVNTGSVVSSPAQLSRPDSKTVNGKTIYAYLAFDQGGGAQDYSVRYSVIEESTGNYLVDDVQIVGGNLALHQNIQVLTFSSSAFIMYQEVSSRDIFIVPVDINTGALGAITTLQTDPELFPGPFTCFSNKAGVGERVFCVYYTNAGQIKVFAIKNDGTIDATMGSFTSTVTISGYIGMDIHYNASSGNLFIGYYDDVNIVSLVLNFTTSSITQVTSQNVYATTVAPSHIAQCDNPLNTAQVYFFFDISETIVYSNGNVAEPEVFAAVLSSSAIVTTAYQIGLGLFISAKALPDTGRETIYLPCAYSSITQGTCFLIDVLKGKEESAFFAQAKFNYGNDVNLNSNFLPSFHQISGSVYSYTSLLKTRISGTGGPFLTSLFQVGISRNEINLAPTYSNSEQYLAKGDHFSGGYLGYYDGAKFCEHGFFLNPEFSELKTMTSSSRASVTIIQQGTASLPEITEFTLPPAPLIPVGPKYFEYTILHGLGPSQAAIRVWYQVNGQGTAPTGGVIMVSLTGVETNEEVAQITADAINNQGNATATFSANVVTVTNDRNGVVPDATVANFTDTTPGPAAGTYQYCYVWSWVDVNGQLMRSAPSVPQTLVTTGWPVSIIIHAPPITNRTCSDVRCEIYRTTASGTVFYKVTTFNQDIPWSSNSQRVSYLDTTVDGTLQTQERLYTTGGVLENYQIPAVKHVSTFKNRIIATGFDNTSVYYSKKNILGEPVEFAPENFFSLDNDDEEITGHRQMDDKLIIGKTGKLIYVVGDGSNDLGQNVSWSQPITIPSDVGIENHNSMQVFPGGMLFKSQKGIYLLGRGLEVQYIGQDVEDYNQFTVQKTELLEETNEVRFILNGTDHTLVYNYIQKQWSVFTQYGGTGATNWQGQFTRVDSDGFVYLEEPGIWVDQGSTPSSYSPVVETRWLRLKNVQDFQRIYKMLILGELKSPHTLNFKVYYDYNDTDFDEYNFDSASVTDDIYQCQVKLGRQKCQSIKIVMSVIPNGGSEESLTMTDMTFLVGVKAGTNKVPAVKTI